jgi:hypothetical protein
MDWIDVNDRLPKVNEHGMSGLALVWLAATTGDMEVSGSWVEPRNQFALGQVGDHHWMLVWPGVWGVPQITHWQPLPDAPGIYA